MSPPLRHPPRGVIWLHIDKLEKKNGRVWAVQDWTKAGKPRYRTTQMVFFKIIGRTRTHAMQPKAVIEILNGRVRTWQNTMWVENVNEVTLAPARPVKPRRVPSAAQTEGA